VHLEAEDTVVVVEGELEVLLEEKYSVPLRLTFQTNPRRLTIRKCLQNGAMNY
jgi:hypothetical protein